VLDHDDVVDILTLVAGSDGRRLPTEADVTLWSLVLAQGGVTSKADACQAVINHLASSDEWIKPFHVIRGVKEIRAARLEEGPPVAELMADIDPDIAGAEYARIYRERIQMVADGRGPQLRSIQGGVA
jgi:hypothetical protein